MRPEKKPRMCAPPDRQGTAFREKIKEVLEGKNSSKGLVMRLAGRTSRFRSVTMPQFRIVEPPKPSAERPACPKCGWAMWLARIEPDKPEHDKRTFECPRCDYQETIVVKYR
jgi:ssDNA-binding Zn-finger/Zn-ribbon topoisomerase 1